MAFISSTLNGDASPNKKNGNRRHSEKSRRVALAVQHRRFGSSFDELTNAELGDICGVSSGMVWVTNQLSDQALRDIAYGYHGTVSAHYKKSKPPQPVPVLDAEAEELFGYLS